jgi:putative membrane protein insertion efficiency factor
MFARLMIALVKLYQRLLSPLLGNVCRFEPSCSRYAVACLETHGAVRGGLLSVVRLCKCHPFHPGGFDPPPLPPRRTPAGPGGHRDGASGSHGDDHPAAHPASPS